MVMENSEKNKSSLSEKISNNSRITTTKIGKKKIVTPCYFTKIKTPIEIDLICDEKKLNQQHQGVFFDLINIDTINREKKIITTTQQRLIPSIKFDFRTLKQIVPIFIDPNIEYFYFKNTSKRKKYRNLLGIPRSIQDMLNTSGWENHDKKWLELDRNGDTNPYINWAIREQNKYQPDAIIPTIPFISDEDSDLVDLAIEINKKASFAIADVNKLEPSFYFSFNYLALRDKHQLRKISDFLMDSDDDYRNVKLIFIKIKNFNETDTDGIRNLGNFIRAIREATKYNGKCTYLIDANSFALPCIATGVDGFCEPLDGYIRDFGGSKNKKKQSTHGNWYNRTKLKSEKFKNIKNKFLKCGCPICKNINENIKHVNEKTIDSLTWNRWRKEHLFYSRCDEITEIRKLIDNKEIMKIIDKFAHSAHKSYMEILGLYTEEG
jgi:hypothetical protein